MIWIALASQLSLPTAAAVPYGDVRGVFSAYDMPDYVLTAGRTRFVFTRTIVGPNGKAQGCTVERSSGDDQLGAYTCTIILKRVRKFEAAKWLDGSPAYGVIRTPITYAIDGPPSEAEQLKAYPPDMEVSVNRLPSGAERRVRLNLIIAADENGRVVGCRERPPLSREVHARRFPELVDIACEQLSRQFTAVPAKDSSGKQVQSVQSATVVFSLGS